MAQQTRAVARATLAEAFDPRRNALNALRLVMAAGVVAGHAALLASYQLPRPITTLLSEGAVDGFFAMSGFLITASYLRVTSVWRYLWHRALRILPGFWVCLVVTAAVIAPIGAWRQGIAGAAYWDAPYGPVQYVLRNALLWIAQPQIANTPSGGGYPLHWNASLWTLYWEVLCYLAVAALGVWSVLRSKRWLVLNLAIGLYLLTIAKAAIPAVGVHFQSFLGMAGPRLALMFALGAVLWLYRDVVPMHPLVAAGAALLLVAGLASGADYRVLGGPAWAYLVLWLGCLLPLSIGRRHDLSYGLYIYAFPVQQVLLIFGLAAWGWAAYVGLSLLVTLPFAAASWWLVERQALNAKSWSPPRSPDLAPRAAVGRLVVTLAFAAFALQMVRPGGY